MFGYYGKMPSQGDFLRRKADVGFVQKWDGWLQSSMSQSREDLGEDWMSAYESAPIWRFCLGNNVCGDDALTGVMMPSQDRVGRCFPLTVFWRSRQSPDSTALEAEPFMTELEDAALFTLEEGSARDRLEQTLKDMTEPDLPYGGNDDYSHWLSMFFGGESRKDSFRFSGLPDPSQFLWLLNPEKGTQHV